MLDFLASPLHTEKLSTSLPSFSSPSFICPALLFLSPLQVALSIQGGGEGHVVEGSRDAVGPCVGSHAGDAVLRLVGGELPSELISCDEVLKETDIFLNYLFKLLLLLL